MPVYEYKCTECTERFEVEQRISDDPLTSMEGCAVAGDGQHQLKKVFSSIGISFKGDGFYRNDSRGGRSSRSTAAPSTSESSSGDSSSGTNGGSTTTKTESAGTSSSGTSTPATPSSSSSSSSSSD